MIERPIPETFSSKLDGNARSSKLLPAQIGPVTLA